MKSPRNVLLDRHRNITPHLDQVREAVLTRELAPGAPEQRPALLTQLWRELVAPYRRAWCALAAVWMLLLLVNLTHSSPAQTAAGNPAPPTPDAQAVLRKQRELMAELAVPHSTTPPGAPSPRSQTSIHWRSV